MGPGISENFSPRDGRSYTATIRAGGREAPTGSLVLPRGGGGGVLLQEAARVLHDLVDVLR